MRGNFLLCVQISDVTDKILPRIEDWKNRPLDEVYPILHIDAIHYSVRDNGVIRKLAAYPMRRKTPVGSVKWKKYTGKEEG